MIKVQVFDLALCCGSGVCGVDVEQALVTFAADVDWLKSRGVTVERFNLAQQPQAFAAHSAVRKLLETRGEAALPVILVDGAVMQRGSYPSRDELTRWTAGIEQAPSIFTEQVGNWWRSGPPSPRTASPASHSMSIGRASSASPMRTCAVPWISLNWSRKCPPAPCSSSLAATSERESRSPPEAR